MILLAAAALAALPAVVRVGQVPAESLPAAVEAGLGPEIVRVDDTFGHPTQAEQEARADVVLAAIGASPKACALRVLELPYLRVSPASLRSLNVPCLARLEGLEINSWLVTDDAARVLATAPFATTLRWLSVGSSLGPQGIAVIVRAMPALERLDVGGANALMPDGAAAIAKADLPRLRELSLGCNRVSGCVPIGEAGAVALAGSTTLPALDELELRGNRIGPAGLRAIVASGLAGRLDRLGLGDNDLDRAVVAELGAAVPGLGVTGLERPLEGAWSSARAAAVRQGDVVPVDVVVHDDEDVRRLIGVTEIRGKLTLRGDVTDLSPLRALTRVTGDVELDDTHALASLEGLGALREIGGSLELMRNRALRSTGGLRSLRTVAGSVSIPHVKAGNPGLVEVSLPALRSVGGSIWMSREPGFTVPDGARAQIATIRTFTKLTHVGRRDGLVEQEPGLFPALPPAQGAGAEGAESP